MPRMWWTPDGGSQERRTLLRDGSVLDPRTPHVVWGNDQTGNRGIITFVMQPQKNRSTSRVPARGVKRSEKSRKRQTADWTLHVVVRPNSYAPVQASRDGVDNPVSRHSSIGLAGAALSPGAALLPRRASGESRRVDSRSRFNLWSYS